MYEQETPKSIRDRKLRLVLQALDKDIMSIESAEDLAVQLVDNELTDDYALSDLSNVFVEARKGINLLNNVSVLLDTLAGNPEATDFIENYVENMLKEK